MQLTIGPVALQMVHTSDLSIKPHFDETGLDLLWHEVSGSAVCQWQPFATATATAPVAPAPGDLLGITTRNLRTVLMQPRQQITLTIGADRCFTSPLGGPFAVGPVLPCDPMGGPFIDEVQFLDIEGDYRATVLVRFRFAYNDDNHIVLSNRWTIRSQTDAESWLTTRIVTGKAVLRMDFLQLQDNANLDPSIVPDQFRRAFILPCPNGFMRKRVEVVATPDGAQLGYTVVDKQMRLNLGQTRITKLHGDVTVGVKFPLSNLGGAMLATLDMVNAGSWSVHQAQFWAGAYATPMAKIVVQVTGEHLSDYATLASFAGQVALDRFAPIALGGQLLIVSSFLTQTFDAEQAPMVQLTIEALPLGPNAIAAIRNPLKVSAMSNTAPIILAQPLGGEVQGPPIATPDPAFGNSTLPNSNNTRGSYHARLVSQILATRTVPGGNYVPVGAVPADGIPRRPDLPLA